jgi:hypothetical protein
VLKSRCDIVGLTPTRPYNGTADLTTLLHSVNGKF